MVSSRAGGRAVASGRDLLIADGSDTVADLTDAHVRHVAKLARLGLTDEEVGRLRGELTDILGYAEKVGEVATEDVATTGHPLRLTNVLRDDDPHASLSPEEALSTAPQAEEGRFRVPRIVEDEA